MIYTIYSTEPSLKGAPIVRVKAPTRTKAKAQIVALIKANGATPEQVTWAIEHWFAEPTHHGNGASTPLDPATQSP